MLDYKELKPKSGNVKQLVFLLHGYGSNKDDLITIAPDLLHFIPDAHFISPDAPHPFEEGMPGGRQWFSLIDRSEKSMLSGARNASAILEDFTTHMMEKLGINKENTAFIGFSQGAMLSLHTGLRMKNHPKSIISYSGMLIAPHLLQDEIIARPDLILIHGVEDQVVPSFCMENAQETLIANGVSVKTCLRPKLAHGIDYEGIREGGEFLRNSFSL